VEKRMAEIQHQQDELGKNQQQLRELQDRLTQRSDDVEKSAIDVQRSAVSVAESASVAERGSQTVKDASSKALSASAKATVSAAELDKLKRETEESSEEAAQASGQIRQFAQTASAQADQAGQNAQAAEERAQSAKNAADQLYSLLPAQVQLMITKETQEVLVHGRKEPCVELSNWILPHDGGISPGKPQTFHVRFRVRHIHLRPVDLYVQTLRDACPSSDSESGKGPVAPGPIFEYRALPRNLNACPQDESANDGGKPRRSCQHRIPGTPFAFQMTFVYDPLLTYDFVVLKIGPDTKLLEYGTDRWNDENLYHDEARRDALPNDAFR